MRYHFKCRVSARECWILYMQRIYHTMVGVISIIMEIAMFALAFRFWSESTDATRVLLVMLCLLVPVVQPLGVYMRCIKQVKSIPKDLELRFSEKEIYVTAGEKAETLSWKKIRYVVKERNMVIIVTNAGGGYMISNTELGDKRDEFYQFASARISK